MDIVEAVEAFIAARKAAKLEAAEKKSDEDVRAAETAKVEAAHEVATWLAEHAPKASQLMVTTHPPKYGHPDADATAIAPASQPPPGLLASGAVAVEPDVCGNAAALAVYGVLMTRDGDGEALLDHLQRSSPEAVRLFEQHKLSFAQCRAEFLSILPSPEVAQHTHRSTRQVYFPVGTDEYHLLSVLTPSGVVSALKARLDVDRFGEAANESRAARRKGVQGEPYRSLLGAATISYGGSKPQNVGFLNKESRGKSYLLPSLPPALSAREVRLPRRSFFKECLRWRRENEEFRALARLVSTDWNNAAIRSGIERRLLSLLGHVVLQASRVRAHPSGWSTSESYQGLTALERAWLDPGGHADRPTAPDAESLATLRTYIAHESALSVLNHLNRLVVAAGVSDLEMNFVRSLFESHLEHYR